MPTYCILETDAGLTVVERPEGSTIQDVADRHQGVIVDAGPYANYEDAVEALEAIRMELDDDEISDVPGSRALEDRWEDGD